MLNNGWVIFYDPTIIYFLSLLERKDKISDMDVLIGCVGCFLAIWPLAIIFAMWLEWSREQRENEYAKCKRDYNG